MAGGVITLNGTGGKITVTNGASATIGANTTTKLDGSVGLTKQGAATLTLNGSDVTRSRFSNQLSVISYQLSVVGCRLSVVTDH